MNLKKLLFSAVIVLSANASFAQLSGPDTNVASHFVNINIPQVALLDLEGPSTTITLAATLPTTAEAGLPITFENATNVSTWMNYSSIVKGAGVNTLLRNVSVAITAGTVPVGLKLTVLAGIATNDGAGTKGTALTTAHTLTATPTIIVSGIGSTYTGDGVGKGRNLTYTLNYAGTATDYADLRFVDIAAPLTITYTLSEI